MLKEEVTETTHSQTPPSYASGTPQERLTAFLEAKLATIGYELVAIEILNHREKSLRVFIDTPQGSGIAIGINDCVTATRELDEPLETNEAVNEIFKGPYELEVSSPGVDRPLRKPSDYVRFSAEYARLHTFRPLTALETGDETYTLKNPKQKNFYGIIRGFETTAQTPSTHTTLGAGSVLFGMVSDDGTRSTLKKGAKVGKKKLVEVKPETLIRIPLELISKANLEPEISFPEEE